MLFNDETQIDSDALTVGTALKEVYKIPDFQREFSWDKENIDMFFEDLTRTNKNDKNFLGAILINQIKIKNRVIYEVIDGQQRMTTICLLLIAMRDMARKELGANNELSEEIHKLLIEKGELIDGKFKPISRIRLNKNNDGVFMTLIQKDPIYKGDERKKSNKLLSNAFELFEKKLKEICLFDGNSEKKLEKKKIDNNLRKILENLITNSILIMIKVPEDDSPYIFEVLNTGGVKLTVANIIRNYFYKNKKFIVGSLKKWDEVEDLLGMEVSNFIRYFWNSKYVFKTVRQVYKKGIKKLEGDKINNFFESLYSEKEIYNYVAQPIFGAYPKNIKSDHYYPINAFNVMGVKTIRPLILSAYSRFCKDPIKEGKSFKKLLEFLEQFLFVVTTCKINTNDIEKKFALCAKSLRSNDQDFEGVINLLKKGDLLPGPDQFKESFINMEITNSKKAKYIFGKIHQKQKGSLTILNPDEEKIQVEHIMPKNISKWRKDLQNWLARLDSESLGEYFKENINKIGNITILVKEDNVSISNKSFSEKVKLYHGGTQQGDFTIMVAGNKWRAKEMGERARSLYKDAKEIWNPWEFEFLI